MRVIGTAGHVDHGKSTLVEALTGIDPDRLKEEKEREMTIDLGFAWMKVDSGQEEIGIIDVPGHRDFIENMLAGVGGIDLALLVIAADEGVMPQTREHLAILDLLRIKTGIVALTKIDLVDDPDWIELVMLDVSETLHGTILEDAPLVPVSAKIGKGIDSLRREIIDRLREMGAKPDLHRPRLPIDRVFTLTGFGTVVTGTLIGGCLRVGDEIEIQPGSKKARIRGLQTHKNKIQIAKPGSRVAVNVTGITRGEIQRGDVLASPGVVNETILCDVEYRHLINNDFPLKHNEEVKLFTGSAEVMARTRVLGVKYITPGSQGFLQLALREPVAIARGDHFILRRPSPAATIGGGEVLDPHPGRRYKRFSTEVILRLKTLADGSPSELLLQVLQHQEPIRLNVLLTNSGLDHVTALQAWEELVETERAITIAENVVSNSGWRRLNERLVGILANYHREAPLRLGMPREELRSHLKLQPQLFNPLIENSVDSGQVIVVGRMLRLPDHIIEFTPTQQDSVDKLMNSFLMAGINSPSVKEVKAIVGEEVYIALLDQGKLVQLNNDVVYSASDYEGFVDRIVAFLRENKQVNAAQVRDLFNTSRKYAIALLEHLDDIRVTKRVGDSRELID